MNKQHALKSAVSLPVFLVLGACAMGPHYTAPEAPLTHTYAVQGDLHTLPAGEGAAQTLATDPDHTYGWQQFGSEPLLHLISQALAHNPDMASAEASLQAANETYRAQASSTLPQVDLSYQGQRAKNAGSLANPLSGNTPPDTYTLHTAQVSVGYTLDVWGSVRRGLENDKAVRDSLADQTEAAREILAGNVVVSALTTASLKEQLAEAEIAAKASRDMLSLMQGQRQLGALGQADLAPYEAALAQDLASAESLKHQLQISEALEKRLVGLEPADAIEAPERLSDFTLPLNLPYLAPASLVEHRPDIAAARETLRAAYASAGAAQADRWPILTLNGTSGGAASQLSHLGASGSTFWDVALGLTAPVTNAIALGHAAKAAEYQLVAAKASYRSTVLNALSNVADCLDALYADNRTLSAELGAQTSADINLQNTRQQAQLGAAGTLQVLAALRTKAQTDITVSAARLQRYADTAAFYVAVGTPAEVRGAMPLKRMEPGAAPNSLDVK